MEEWIRELITGGKRLDGRKFDELRPIQIKAGVVEKAEGSGWVSIGNTQVLAGVKLELGTPYPDTPNEGVLKVHAEFSPVAAPEFEAGPPREDAIELARVVDRGIRESKCIEVDKLCLIPAEKVWIVHVDVEIQNHAGNLLDTAALAALVALRNAKVPKVEDDEVVRGEYEMALPIVWKPINLTICKIGGQLLLDPSLEEESVIDTKLSVCVRDDDFICSLQKQGSGTFTPNELEQGIELVVKKSKQVRKMVK